MSSVTSSLILYDLYSTQASSTQQGMKIIDALFKKLDSLHSQSQKLIDSQGNLSSVQRQKIIAEFEAVAPLGGLATKFGQQDNNHKLSEILGNLTELNNKLGR
jgi:hypothetical protein